jgi:hypothetical protein
MRFVSTLAKLVMSAAFVSTALAFACDPAQAVAAPATTRSITHNQGRATPMESSSSSHAGSATSPTSNAAASPDPQTTIAPAPQQTLCPSNSPTQVAANSQISVSVDPTTAWQPRGGSVIFRVESKTVDLNGATVTVCFGWNDRIAEVSTPRIQSFDANAIVYHVMVPKDLPHAPADVETEAPWVPAANMRIIVSGGKVSPPIDVVEPIGITTSLFGVIVAALTAAIALIFCYMVARRRGVPGTNIVLQIISTQSGYASLSQFQLILWTMVVGVGAVYVMVLSGNLLDITTGALVLLGISGGAIVASKIQNNQVDKQAAAPLSTGLQPPGPIQTVYCDAVTDSEASLRWVRPIDGGPVSAYIVEYAVVPPAGVDLQWLRVLEPIDQARHTTLDLIPATQYTFRVAASNAAGQGEPSPAIFAQTAPLPPLLPNAPGPTTGLSTVRRATSSSVSLAWFAAAAATAYLVEKRQHDSGSPWEAVPTLAPSATTTVVSNLEAGTQYDFRVTARNGGVPGLPSSVITVRTLRKPLWSDLVVTGYDEETIDVTRLQALFFTMIAAAFVSLKILTGYTIPDIPDGFLILMGISNGVYIGAKFVPNN